MQRSRSLSPIFLSLLTVMIIVTIVAFPRVAASAGVNHSCSAGGRNASTENCALTISNSGDQVYVFVTAWMDAASCPPSVSTNSTGGSETFSYVANSKCQNQANGFGGEQIWASTYSATTASAHTVSITLSSGMGANGVLAIFAFDTSGAPNTVSAVVTGSATNTAGQTGTFGTTLASFGSPSLLLAGIISGVTSSNMPVAGTGFTMLGASTGAACSFYSAEYSTDSSVSSPTTFPWTISADTCGAAAPWLELGVAVGLSGSSTGTFGIGSCPTKNTATFTMVNSTQYFYTTSNPGVGTIVASMTAGLASVTSVASTETLWFGIYSTAGAGTVSASNPLVIVASKSWTLTAGTKNQILAWSVGYTEVAPTGATMAISVLGNSKINLNQSSLAGVYTGSSAGPSTLATQFTSLTPVGTQLYLCGTLLFQSIVTSTTTVTGSVTSTVLTTTTITTASLQGITNQLPYLLLDIVVILGPSLIMAELTKQMWGGLLGAILGVAAAVLVGIAPFWLVIIVGLGCVTALLLSRGVRQGGGV